MTNYREYQTIRSALEAYTHKQFDKKFERFLPDGYTFIKGVNGPKIKTPSGREHLVCYFGESPTPELFDERDACYRLESNRASELWVFANEEVSRFDAYVEKIHAVYHAYKLLGEYYMDKNNPEGDYSVRHELGMFYNVFRLANIHAVK